MAAGTPASQLTLHTGTAVTSTENGSTKRLIADFGIDANDVTAVVSEFTYAENSGADSTATLDVDVETSFDGSKWYKFIEHAQVGGTDGTFLKSAQTTATDQVPGVIGPYVRSVLTIGGTNDCDVTHRIHFYTGG